MPWNVGIRWNGIVLAVFGLALVTTSCGGTSTTHGDDERSGAGGAGATGGSGASAAGGTGASDLPPQPAAMGVSLMLSPPSAGVANVGSRTCNAGTSGAFTYRIGNPAPGQTIADDTQGAIVTCTVTANGEFDLTGGGVDENGQEPVSFTFAGSIHDRNDTTQNVGSMTFFSPDTGHLQNLLSFPSCTFGPITVEKPGAILTDVDCPLIGAADDAVSGCAVHGTIAFEYCDTSAPTQ